MALSDHSDTRPALRVPLHAFRAHLPQHLPGIVWMLFAGFFLVGVNVSVRQIGDDIPAVQAAFVRFVWGTLFVLPLLLSALKTKIPGELWRLHLWRGAFHILAVVFWFYAMIHTPPVEVTAIGYATPVLLSILAVLFLGERLSLSRGFAVLVALAGMFVVMRPGFRELGLGHVSQVAAALFFAGAFLFGKRLAMRVDAGHAVAILSFVVMLGLAPPALAVWQEMSLFQALMLALVALLATLAQYCMSRSFAASPLAVNQPVTFLQIVWTSCVGIVFFGDLLDPFVLLGGGMIVGAVTYTAWRDVSSQAHHVKDPEC